MVRLLLVLIVNGNEFHKTGAAWVASYVLLAGHAILGRKDCVTNQKNVCVGG